MIPSCIFEPYKISAQIRLSLRKNLKDNFVVLVFTIAHTQWRSTDDVDTGEGGMRSQPGERGEPHMALLEGSIF